MSTYGMGLAKKFSKILLALDYSVFTRRRRLFIFSFFWKLKIKKNPENPACPVESSNIQLG